MIAHVVLFRPRPDLSPPGRESLVRALATALGEIPSIRRSRVGKRVRHGRPYEDEMSVNYEYAAILEFDDVAGLTAYLEHSAHERLAAAFYSAVESALMYDFELGGGASALEGLLG